jgi:glycosyltransferase involved in cell wall biosynthesis
MRPRPPRLALRYFAEDACTGYGESSYRLVEALRARGVAVEYRGFHAEGDGRDLCAHVNPYRRDEQPDCQFGHDVPTIAHLVPEHYRAVRELVGDVPLIGHTVWETDLVPAHWPEMMNAVEAVLVPCEWNRQVFVDGGVTSPISIVPHVVCDPVPGDRGVPLDLPDDVLVFYTIARWDPRKAPWLTMRAFLEAFTSDDRVALVVKTTPTIQARPLGKWGLETPVFGTTSLEVARLLREYPHAPHVRLEVHDISPDRMAGLHWRGDCYVSLAHGEGWGLGEFDACAYGNPVVTTGWGGHLAYLDPDAAWLVDYELVPVRHHEPLSYSADQKWAEPSIENAAQLLREVAADISGARQRAAPLRERVRCDYAGPTIAERALAAVDGIGGP